VARVVLREADVDNFGGSGLVSRCGPDACLAAGPVAVIGRLSAPRLKASG
jgi:hypothetical protein